MLNVATATAGIGSVRYMPRNSDRALPHAQNERVRGILRELVRDEFAGAVKKTADARVARSVLHPSGRGASLFPVWFIRLIPPQFWGAE